MKYEVFVAWVAVAGHSKCQSRFIRKVNCDSTQVAAGIGTAPSAVTFGLCLLPVLPVYQSYSGLLLAACAVAAA